MKYKLCLSLTVGFILVYIIYTLKLAENSFKFCLGRPVSTISGLSTARSEEYCPQKMVLQINSGGQLGNQMMDYGTAYVAARELSGHAIMLDNARDYLQKYFNHIDKPDISDHCRRTKEKKALLNNETGAKFKELFYNGSANATTVAKFSATNDNVVFGLYDWVPILYPKYLEELKHVFRFKDSILNETLTTFEYIKRLYLGVEKPLLFVGVHIRRGDYKNHLQALYKIKLLDPEYYLTAMKYFNHKYSQNYTVVFLAVSNDVNWVRDHIKFDNFYVVSKGASVDMALLSLCNHTITDYGTFGLWPSLFHKGEHYTTNIYEDFIVAMMYQVKGWTVINISTPFHPGNHPDGYIKRPLLPETKPLPGTPLHLESTW